MKKISEFDPFEFMTKRSTNDKLAADELVHNAIKVAAGEVKHVIHSIDPKTGKHEVTTVNNLTEWKESQRTMDTIEEIRKVAESGPQAGSGGRDKDHIHTLLAHIDELVQTIATLETVVQAYEREKAAQKDGQTFTEGH